MESYLVGKSKSHPTEKQDLALISSERVVVLRPIPPSFLCLPGHFLQFRMVTALAFFENKCLHPVLRQV